ncbi:hypothetical protein DFAR_1660001 [Desulfarculales bacterium]
MFDFLLSREQLALQGEVRELVKWVPRQMILDMDQDKIQFPKEFLQEAGRRGLLAAVIPVMGGGGGMEWLPPAMVRRK